jgi:hypothetical protein
MASLSLIIVWSFVVAVARFCKGCMYSLIARPSLFFANVQINRMGEPLDELAEDIKANGLREYIRLWQDKIIDGRNRYAACRIAGVEPTYKDVKFRDADAALAYVISRNLKRR